MTAVTALRRMVNPESSSGTFFSRSSGSNQQSAISMIDLGSAQSLRPATKRVTILDLDVS
jgi:hypothetical protein